MRHRQKVAAHLPATANVDTAATANANADATESADADATANANADAGMRSTFRTTKSNCCLVGIVTSRCANDR